MRRWIHSLVVALLCLTLFVDTAKACWFLRHHHRRAPACRPVPSRPVCPTPCCLPCEPVDTVCDTVVAEHVSAAAREVSEFTVEEAVVTTTPADAPVARQPDAAAVAESVLQHGPTLVVGPQPSATAAPIVVPESAGLAAREPLPNLKPTQTADPAMVAPASNDEPADEPADEPVAATDSQAKTSAPGDDAEAAGAAADPKPPVAEKPMPAEPAPAENLAGGPEAKPTARAPQEPNLFDLLGDEEPDDDAPAGEEKADAASDENEEETDGVEKSEAMAGEEEAEDASEAADEETADEESPAKPAEDDAEAPGEQPDDEPAATENDPFAAVTIPAEPMRRWTDDTGTRHAQGWLVEMHSDRVRILKTNGRHTTVPLESLSAADRDYVTAVGARLAAERTGQNPAATATAGL